MSGISCKSDTFEIVPQKDRRGPITMGLLWVTMVTAFPTVLIGFEWYKCGLTLAQVVASASISILLLLAYVIPASYLGAKTGQSYGALNLNVLGNWATKLATFNLLWIFIAWYGVTALFLAEGLKGLYHWNIPIVIMAASLAILMAFNNFFGFKGVANFARFIAAPILVVWVIYTFIKVLYDTPIQVLDEPSHKSFTYALTLVSSFVIGYGAWGNECDYWRYGKAKLSYSIIPLALSLIIGMLIFPATGWMLANMSNITEFATATNFINQYSFGGIAIIAALVLATSYFAVNDSNLLGSANAIESFFPFRHRTTVTILAIAGAAMAAWLSLSGATKAVEAIASLNCVILPMPTVIVLSEWLLATYLFKSEPIFAQGINLSEIPLIRWPATIALVIGCSLGIATSGVIPNTEALHVGIASVQAWIVTALVYIPLRWQEYKKEVWQANRIIETILLSDDKQLVGAARD
jgi:purine-cytosine permease-like protein